MSSHNDSFVASGSSPTGVDFICENHGSVFLLRPISPAAFLSIHENLPADRQMVKKQEREISDAEIATWRSRAESARVETPSGLVVRGKTEEVQKIMVNGADGRIDWKATAQARERTAARMNGQRVRIGWGGRRKLLIARSIFKFMAITDAGAHP